MTHTRIQVSLETGCDHASCAQFAFPLLKHLEAGYEICAAQEIPSDLDEWRDDHRTARKRASRCERRGYLALSLRRENHEQEIHEINNSSARRQGKPMSPSYRAMTRFTPLPSYPCARHAIRTTGVFRPGDGRLVAYLTMYRCGELALVSQILGHADHLHDEIMFLLFRRALEREIRRGPGVVIYNRWDSGTEGLRLHKRLLGFHETEIEWVP